MFPDFSKLQEILPKIQNFIDGVLAIMNALSNEQKAQREILDRQHDLITKLHGHLIDGGNVKQSVAVDYTTGGQGGDNVVSSPEKTGD